MLVLAIWNLENVGDPITFACFSCPLFVHLSSSLAQNLLVASLEVGLVVRQDLLKPVLHQPINQSTNRSVRISKRLISGPSHGKSGYNYRIYSKYQRRINSIPWKAVPNHLESLTFLLHRSETYSQPHLPPRRRYQNRCYRTEDLRQQSLK